MSQDIQAIISQMTLEEKAALCTGASAWTTTPIERLGVPELTCSDGPHGVRRVPDVHEMTRQSLPATCFPTASCIASTWDVELIRKMGEAIGRRMHRPECGCGSRSGREYETLSAGRPQLRVFLRRPLPGRGDGGQLHQRRAEQRRRHLAQTFCRQQPGIPTFQHQRRSRRAHACAKSTCQPLKRLSRKPNPGR